MTSETTDGPAEPAGISGRSRDGRALAHHRAPPPALAPWIARLFVTVADQPARQTIACGLFNDTPFVRVIVRGAWQADTANGMIACSHGPLLFGPHSRRMPVRVTGPFATLGFALRPGALAALRHPWGPARTDTIVPIASDAPWLRQATAHFDDRSPDHWIDRMEERLLARIAASRPPPPDPLAEALDLAAFADPTISIADFAARHAVNARTVTRMAKRDFGLSAKQVMRRARVLDMASQLIGFADRAEADEHALRFYDQSHLIRDFRALIGMTPRDLARNPHPILALGLEPRQARRLETLGRLESGQPLPWR